LTLSLIVSHARQTQTYSIRDVPVLSLFDVNGKETLTILFLLFLRVEGSGFVWGERLQLPSLHLSQRKETAAARETTTVKRERRDKEREREGGRAREKKGITNRRNCTFGGTGAVVKFKS